MVSEIGLALRNNNLNNNKLKFFEKNIGLFNKNLINYINISKSFWNNINPKKVISPVKL